VSESVRTSTRLRLCHFRDGLNIATAKNSIYVVRTVSSDTEVLGGVQTRTS